MKRTAIMLAVAAGILSGCGVSEAANSSSNLQQELDHEADHMKDTNAFLPVYVDMLQGKKPFPADDVTARQLKAYLKTLIGCV